MRSRAFTIPALLLSAALLLGGCSFRPEAAVRQVATPVPTEAAASPEPTATPVPRYTVEYRMGETVLASLEVDDGQISAPPALPEGVRLAAWRSESGETVLPEEAVIHSDTVFFADTRPVLSLVPFLFPDERGLLRPESPLTGGEAEAMGRALYPDAIPAAWATEADRPVPAAAFREGLHALFLPREADAALAELLPEDAETVTRSQAAAAVIRLLGAEGGAPDSYYPDVSPASVYGPALLSAAPASALTAEDWLSRSKEGFLWLEGYLYRLGEDGYFLRDQTADGLYYDANGRYTCGIEELDKYVADTIVQFAQPEATRQEDLRALYLHVKNDFRYLVRNHYDSGAEGWELDEALTMFQTGKGNCYNFTGAFCCLARGMGYNARTWSGTMGVRNQPHSWTEITLDGKIYICDPEIELNYWLLDPPIYSNNFMMPKEESGGWNYQAVGRPGI